MKLARLSLALLLAIASLPACDSSKPQPSFDGGATELQKNGKPTPTPTAVPGTATPTPAPTATFTPSPTATPTIDPSATATPTPTPTPTPVPVSLSGAPPTVALQDDPYTFTPKSVPATGVTFSIQNKPSWASFDPATGTLSGIAGQAGDYPNILITGTANGYGPGGLPAFNIKVDGDPLEQYAWHLHNTGQTTFGELPGTAGEDSKVLEALHAGFSGSGVKVAVSDTGCEIAHEDLKANQLVGLSKNYNTGAPYFGDPTPTGTGEDHGTMVTGIIAAVRGNGIGSRGVSPSAKFAVYNLLDPTVNNSTSWALFAYDALGGAVDITSASWGYADTSPPVVDSFFQVYQNKVKSHTTNGRGGKGALFVKAAGNEYFYTVESPTNSATDTNPLVFRSLNANADPIDTMPYMIIVGAVNANGIKSSYSSMGSNVWVAAPGGEFGFDTKGVSFYSFLIPYGNPVGANSPIRMPAILTTDRSSCSAGTSVTTTKPFNTFESGSPLNSSCNYTSTMNGTSSATPFTSAAIALILQANPNLTWRDVKHILATTAQKIDPNRGPTSPFPYDVKGLPMQAAFLAETAGHLQPAWVTNAKGYHFNNWYGFGRVDAAAATQKAVGYDLTTMGTLQMPPPTDRGTISLTPDAQGTITDTLNVTTSLTLEAVRLHITAANTNTGDLGIELTSPAGTTSIVLNAYNGWTSGTAFSDTILLTNAMYFENSAGTWTIKVVKAPAGTTLTNWKLELWGH